VDTQVRHTWELSPDKVKILNPGWETGMNQLVKHVQKSLGCEKFRVEANLDKLLIYETGSKFLPHQDTEKEKGMFATLIVQLPSVYEGGSFVVHQKNVLSERKTNILLNLVKIFGWDKIYESILQKSFEASLKSSLKSSISFAFFLLKDFEISNSEHVQILLKLCFNQVIEELSRSKELIPSGIELIAAYCKEQNLVDRILNVFKKGQKRREYLKEMADHLTTQYSTKDIEDSSILFKIIDLRLIWLKQSTAVIPKFSWDINLSKMVGKG
jgi:hypothetical protein